MIIYKCPKCGKERERDTKKVLVLCSACQVGMKLIEKQLECKQFIDLNKVKDYQFLNNDDETNLFLKCDRQGLVKPLSMWGCKLCKERLGISDYAIYNIWGNNQDYFFCSCHGFLHENQTFRRSRRRIKFKRNLL